MDIITEEASAYFAGDKSAEEVTKLIQNRVTIYLGETS
jgi:multiple sugar transport system substrate-binding protein